MNSTSIIYKQLKLLLIGLLALLVAVACTPTGGSEPAARIDPEADMPITDVPDLSGSSWVLNGILVGGDAMTTTDFDQEITINFENGQANGSAGCNSYFATYMQNGTILTFEGIGQTEMACTETERMERESLFLTELANTGRVTIEGSEMTFWHKDGNYRTLVFTRAESTDAVTELEGTSWTLGGILVGGDAMTTSDIDSEITLNFENGQANGSAGCNSYGSTYTVEGNTLTLGLINSTLMACEGERMDRETQYLTALGEIGSYTIENNQLTLLHKDGNYPVLVFNMADTNVAQANLEDTLWILNGIVIGGDAVSGSEVDQNINATFSAGQVAGSAGCNSYSASYELNGESLTLSAPVSTKMACADEQVMQRETEFLSALEKVGSYSIEDNMLTLNDAQGLPLLMFVVAGSN